MRQRVCSIWFFLLAATAGSACDDDSPSGTAGAAGVGTDAAATERSPATSTAGRTTPSPTDAGVQQPAPASDRDASTPSQSTPNDAGTPTTPSTPRDASAPSAPEPSSGDDAGTDTPEPSTGAFTSRTLPNGLSLYYARDPDTANVTVQVWYKVGSKDDPAGRSGFAHLFEHLMFQGTRNLPSGSFDRLVEDVGGSLNAFTADDTTAYYQIVPANHLERVLFAESERLGSLVVDQTAFQSERDVVKEELRQRILADPYGRLFGLYLPQEAYQEHPYRRPGIGSIENLDAAQISEVLAFHSTFYRPDNAYLIVVGNFDEAQLNGWVDQYFGPIAQPERALPANDVKEPPRTAARTATYYAPNVPLPVVLLNWQVPRYADADNAALTVLDGILSNGVSSRLYRSLVYTQQSAAEAGASLDLAQQAGNYSVYAVMAEGRDVAAGETALLAEIAKLRDSKVTAAELSEAKNEIVASSLRNRESLLGRGNDIGNSLIMTGTPDAAERVLAQVQAVTADDVQRVAQRYLTDNTRVTLRYLNDATKPANAPAEPRQPATGAPIQLSDLAPAGPAITLAPEANRVPLPAAGPDLTVPTPDVVERRLASGLRVLVVPRHALPLVSARLSFAAGSAADPAGKSGLASLTASLVSEGTANKTAPEIATEIETLGASVGGSASYDFTNLYASSPADVFTATAELLAEVARTPAFAAEEVERIKTQTLDGLLIARGDPAELASSAVARVVYGAAPYGTAAAGTATSVPTISAEDVLTFYRTRWRPSTATLVFSGDIEPDAAFALAERLFGDWQDAQDAAEPVAEPAGPVQPARVVVIDLPGAGQAAVTTANRALTRSDPDYYPLLVGNAVLGGGYSARLNRVIRIERGLSYGASSSLAARRGDGLLVAQAQTRNDAATQVATLIKAELSTLTRDLVSADELAPRRATLLGSFSRALETVDGLGAQVATLAAYALPLSELKDYSDKVRAVTPEQVREVAARRLAAGSTSVIIAGDASLFFNEFQRANPTAERIPAASIDFDSPTLR